jgi:hypothetical protein
MVIAVALFIASHAICFGISDLKRNYSISRMNELVGVQFYIILEYLGIFSQSFQLAFEQ